MIADSVFAWKDLIWLKFELHPKLAPQIKKASVRSVVVTRTLIECDWWSYYNPHYIEDAAPEPPSKPRCDPEHGHHGNAYMPTEQIENLCERFAGCPRCGRQFTELKKYASHLVSRVTVLTLVWRHRRCLPSLLEATP